MSVEIASVDRDSVEGRGENSHEPLENNVSSLSHGEGTNIIEAPLHGEGEIYETGLSNETSAAQNLANNNGERDS